MVDERVFIGLGSNMGDRALFLQRATLRIARLQTAVRLTSSFVYLTQPREVEDQNHFLNAVIEVTCCDEPHALLGHLLHIERELGRQRTMEKGPRCIDLDLLLFGQRIISTPTLVVPHPRLTRRRFVLIPLCDIAPDLAHPLYGRTLRELLSTCDDQGLVSRTHFTLDQETRHPRETLPTSRT